MENFNWLLQGFAEAATPMNLLYAAIGVLLGTAVGVLPGIGPATAVAMILRFIITLVDVLWALFGWLWGRAHRLIGDRPSGRTGSRGASAA